VRVVVKESPSLWVDYNLLGTESLEAAQIQVGERQYPREVLVAVLEDYNRRIGNDSNALGQIQLLKDSKRGCIVTGQQLGFMGGASYTILKAITCLMLAREAHATPVFWLATEDHDIDEIDHTLLVDALGNLQKFHIPLPKDGRSVEDITISSHQMEAVSHFVKALDIPEIPLEEGISYSEAMLKYLVKLFAGTGMVFLEPYLLRPLAVDFFRKELILSDEIASILKKTSKNLEEQPIEVGDGTNLFLKVGDNKLRKKISRLGGQFEVDTHTYEENELLDLLEDNPHLFSTNVAARPVLQSLVLPTLAYVGGPSEIAYHYQLTDYFRFHDVPMPWIVPRLSATVVTSYAASLLKKCGVEPWDPVPQHWDQVLPDIEQHVNQMSQDWQKAAKEHFSEDLTDEVLSRNIHQAAMKIQKKIYKARLHKHKIPYYSLHYLRNYLHPHHALQERMLNWHGFQVSSQENLIAEFLEQVKWQTKGHLYCEL